jgi:hypothetical protein
VCAIAFRPTGSAGVDGAVAGGMPGGGGMGGIGGMDDMM